jgi:hypothetical protein
VVLKAQRTQLICGTAVGAGEFSHRWQKVKRRRIEGKEKQTRIARISANEFESASNPQT